MAEDPKVSDRYRELPREEPPRALDGAILAASRRALEEKKRSHPAPLVAPTGRQRWYFPLAAAAVIVLAVAVTVHVERERPDAEILEGPVAVQKAPPAEEVVKAEAPRPAPSAPPKAARKVPERTFAPDPQPQAAPAAPPVAQAERSDAAAAAAGSREMRAQRDVAASSGARPSAAPASRAEEPARAAPALAKLGEQSPEQWLQGIADLRRQRRHEEAEKQLAEFRKRYPNYRIPEAILRKFEK